MVHFKITFIDQAGHRHAGTVPGGSLNSVLDQLEREYGEPVRLACIRLPLRPALRLVHTDLHRPLNQERRH